MGHPHFITCVPHPTRPACPAPHGPQWRPCWFLPCTGLGGARASAAQPPPSDPRTDGHAGSGQDWTLSRAVSVALVSSSLKFYAKCSVLGAPCKGPLRCGPKRVGPGPWWRQGLCTRLQDETAAGPGGRAAESVLGESLHRPLQGRVVRGGTSSPCLTAVCLSGAFVGRSPWHIPVCVASGGGGQGGGGASVGAGTGCLGLCWAPALSTHLSAARRLVPLRGAGGV